VGFVEWSLPLRRDHPPLAVMTTPPSDKDKDVYVAPRSIFTCAALRTLRLVYCCLDDLPSSSSAVALPSLDTLHLTGVTGGNRAVERLVSSCPRLAALTLEACAMVTALSVPADARLRTLALRCCHDLAAVVVADASELRAFEYRGAVPAGPSFLTLHGGALTVSSCTLDFCGEEAVDPLHLAGLSDMLRLFVGVERLHLTSARLGFRGALWLSPSAFPAFTKLRHLELTGMLPDDDDDDDDATAIDVVTRILERTLDLETLTLFFMPEPELEPGTQKFYRAWANITVNKV